jgi:hypothetical protein
LEFKDVELKITQIKMEEFEEYFMGLLTGGNNIIGKVIVKFWKILADFWNRNENYQYFSKKSF